MSLTLERYIHGEKATIGRLLTETGAMVCYTLELPKTGLPCRIIEGIYRVAQYESPANKCRVWLLSGVPGRSFIEIHPANYPSELKGCIAPGTSVAVSKEAVWNSKKALQAITDIVGGWDKTWNLEVKSV